MFNKLTKRVTIEMSRRCNYASMHKKCPVHHEKDPKYLKIDVIMKTLEDIYMLGFNGIMAFHNYSEPMADPRLFLVLDKVRKLWAGERKLKSALILTNGYFLDQTMLDDLFQYGINEVNISIYSAEEEARLAKLVAPEGLRLVFHHPKLDQRLDAYDRNPETKTNPCYCPLGEILIHSTGDVALCCRDWRGDNTFGNLYTSNIAEILNTGKMQEVYVRLSKGDRFLPICKRCRCARQYSPDWQRKV